MKIVKGYPPNYEAISKRFDIRGKNIIFAYGDTLYTPSGQDIPKHLMIHEETHEKQQRTIGAEAWWDRYFIDDEFRLEQEVEAYRAQYQFIKQNLNRSERRRLLAFIVRDLSGPIYGNLVSKEVAEELITAE